MTQDLSEHILQPISQYILSQTGLFFPPSKWNLLTKGLKAAATDHHMDVSAFAAHILESPPTSTLINSLAAYLTIGETYFLRDKNLFQTLKDHILMDIMDSPQAHGKRLSFLSAGCATGEEPYSIAILIDHMCPILKNWKISIIGTDINPVFLDKARKGIYSRWSLRETPEQIVKKYFIQTEANQFELAPHIRRMVQFAQLNLMEPDYAHALNIRAEINILFCRNVLMYFDDVSRNQVIEKLCRLIANNGWFITGVAESGFVQTPELTPVKFSHIVLYQKKPPPLMPIPIPRAADNMDVSLPIPSVATPGRSPGSVSRPKQPGAAFSPKPKTDFELYQEALNDYEKGDYQASALKLGRLMNRRQPDDSVLIETDLLILLAKSYANLGDLCEAEFWCRKAIASEKLNPEIHFLMSSILQAGGKIPEAIESLKNAIYLDPDFIMAHFLMGLLLHHEKNVMQSRKYFENALSLLRNKDPDEIVPFSEGLTAGRLLETITTMTAK